MDAFDDDYYYAPAGYKSGQYVIDGTPFNEVELFLSMKRGWDHADIRELREALSTTNMTIVPNSSRSAVGRIGYSEGVKVYD